MIAGKYTVQQCMDTAERVVSEKTSSYKMLDINKENHIPKFQMNGMFKKLMHLPYFAVQLLDDVDAYETCVDL
jgi:hypothetical protein